MKYYAVAEIEITDRSWVSNYVKNVTKLVEQHGGRYLARTSRMEKLEGERPRPQVFLIIEWPSEEAAKAFYESDAYKPYLQSRKQGSRGDFILVAGEDINKTAQMAE
jgi:uncharacterized protein (DUF1330 family)